jgi:hypothetical protein
MRTRSNDALPIKAVAAALGMTRSDVHVEFSRARIGDD